MVLYLWTLVGLMVVGVVLFDWATRAAKHDALQRYRRRRSHVKRMRAIRARRERVERLLAN